MKKKLRTKYKREFHSIVLYTCKHDYSGEKKHPKITPNQKKNPKQISKYGFQLLAGIPYNRVCK